MKKREMQAEELQTMELLSGKIEAQTPCGQSAQDKAGKAAAEKIGKAVGAAADRARKKTQK